MMVSAGRSLSLLAPAKVNLSLKITGRRADGYHLLDSLVAFAAEGDRISVAPADDLTLTYSGCNAGQLPEAPENLVWRAAYLLKAWAEPRGHGNLGAAIRLEKSLPVAGGIGGGSSDAAACLLGLRTFWGLDVDDDTLMKLGLRLGADVPVCLMRRTMRMTGIGDVLEPVRLPATMGIVLLNPGVALSTEEVFVSLGHARGEIGEVPAERMSWPNMVEECVSLLRDLGNDLEVPAIRLRPEIETALGCLRALPDCLLAHMSGSGATCFGLFRDSASAEDALRALSIPTGWWATATFLCDHPDLESNERLS